jgi:hypothetical protein
MPSEKVMNLHTRNFAKKKKSPENVHRFLNSLFFIKPTESVAVPNFKCRKRLTFAFGTLLDSR